MPKTRGLVRALVDGHEQLRRKPSGPKTTPPKRCTIVAGSGVLAVRCEARRFKAGRCSEHYGDWRGAREARAIEAQQRLHQATERGGQYSPPAIRWAPRAERWKKKRPHSATDSAWLQRAELKRRRKAEKRNRDRAVILGAGRGIVIEFVVRPYKAEKMRRREQKARERGL